ncbi:MAG: fatty acid desaturase [Candidatus Tectomicrobia bacterium]|nr:fatty acid desaturase [Candidatus Tectomicrobia bacterium]
MSTLSTTHFPSKPSVWKSLVAKYQTAHTWKSIWQLCNTFIPFLMLWYLMYLTFEISYWLTLPLAFPTAGFLVRLFIIQHDCGHGSFFKSRKVNDRMGMFCSLFTWTPYYYWQKSHAIHHAHAGDLEHRGIGDVYTMTVNEYLQQGRWRKLKYRLYRNSLILFVFVPILLFIVLYRFPTSRAKAMKKVQSSVYWTNLALGLVVGGMIWLVGLKAFLLVHAPILVIASSAGAWLFFIQHQFEGTYWANNETWDYTLAALQGSSYYKLPKILQWFTGNIGFHHIHHLSPRIPNYLLEKCHDENPMFQETVVLTLRTSLKSIFLSLWDEEQKRLISFHDLKQRQPEIAEIS